MKKLFLLLLFIFCLKVEAVGIYSKVPAPYSIAQKVSIALSSVIGCYAGYKIAHWWNNNEQHSTKWLDERIERLKKAKPYFQSNSFIKEARTIEELQALEAWFFSAFILTNKYRAKLKVSTSISMELFKTEKTLQLIASDIDIIIQSLKDMNKDMIVHNQNRNIFFGLLFGAYFGAAIPWIIFGVNNSKM
jgi:hypothetical protein